MEKSNLTFSQLVDLMRQAVANTSRLAKGDTLTDIVIITSLYESCREVAPKENVVMDYYWGVRHNGTGLKESEEDIKEWLDFHKNEAVAIYKISYRDGFYKFSLYLSVDDGDILFRES